MKEEQGDLFADNIPPAKENTNYFTHTLKEDGIIYIEDINNNKAHKTVLSDTINVILSLFFLYGNLSGRVILYKEKEGNIKKINVSQNTFIGFSPYPGDSEPEEELGIF
jgi:hypothetical protein